MEETLPLLEAEKQTSKRGSLILVGGIVVVSGKLINELCPGHACIYYPSVDSVDTLLRRALVTLVC